MIKQHPFRRYNLLLFLKKWNDFIKDNTGCLSEPFLILLIKKLRITNHKNPAFIAKAFSVPPLLFMWDDAPDMIS